MNQSRREDILQAHRTAAKHWQESGAHMGGEPSAPNEHPFSLFETFFRCKPKIPTSAWRSPTQGRSKTSHSYAALTTNGLRQHSALAWALTRCTYNNRNNHKRHDLIDVYIYIYIDMKLSPPSWQGAEHNWNSALIKTGQPYLHKILSVTNARGTRRALSIA